MRQFTGFYGFAESSRRRDSWNFICNLNRNTKFLSSVVFDYRLIDVHMNGYHFTWFKSLGTPKADKERLARVFANKDIVECKKKLAQCRDQGNMADVFQLETLDKH
ncbi:hypothetical protein MTR_4g029320 [Medicago truncatula]|uniref:Uncharacterized protein n=1 Tax=Medicago truncatula TaxID=3880 RepID=G7JJJ3_MEDTR|nr:hypothetical protein MTR_4g029320 [Medicago truncatula]